MPFAGGKHKDVPGPEAATMLACLDFAATSYHQPKTKLRQRATVRPFEEKERDIALGIGFARFHNFPPCMREVEGFMKHGFTHRQGVPEWFGEAHFLV